MKCDFEGWATRANRRCSDGRTIMPDAFKDNYGKTVPLVWQHDHNDPSNILGHADLENRGGDVYCRCFFNDSPRAQDAKVAVQHGDIRSLSIYANHLSQDAGKNVMHGDIKEVSLVIAGANPGALIQSVAIQHGDEMDYLDDEAIIFTGEELMHSDDDSKNQAKQEPKENMNKNQNEDQDSSGEDDKTIQDVIDSMTNEQKEALYALVGMAAQGKLNQNAMAHADDKADSGDQVDLRATVNSMNDEQKEVLAYLVGKALEESGQTGSDDSDDNEMQQSEGDYMSYNAFEDDSQSEPVLSHDDMREIMTGAEHNNVSSFKNYLEHAAQNYGIKNIDVLFPDAQSIRNTPDFYKRRTEWVNSVLNGTNHVPFSRIRSAYADITKDEARAKGYTLDRDNNHRKIDEVFNVLKRETTPQTVYKKQKLDRDDVVDITNFDIVAWLKQEMRVMLDEEVARAVLIGDGRDPSAEDKIKTDRIRPIAFDDDLYTIKSMAAATDEKPAALIDRVVNALVDYQGSGTTTAYMSPQTKALLFTQRDQLGRRLYSSDQALAQELGVSAIVEVPVMNGIKDSTGNPLEMIVVNLRDYTIGADKGGDVSMFDDFDIDFNQQKYLLETRCSGALTLPKSAVAVFGKKTA